MDVLNAVVVGCGRMGAEPSSRLQGLAQAGWLPISHAECVQAVDGLALAALCDVDATRLATRGRQYGVDALYTDYRAALRELRPAVVAVATRTPEKADIVLEACANGARALYVEKPLGNSLADVDRALAAAAAAGVVVGYGVNRRYHAVYRRARALLREGAVGEVTDVVVEHGRAQLLWAHPHSVDLALFLLGRTDVESVQAALADDTVARAGARVVDSDPVVEHAHFRFASGQSATIVRTGGTSVRVGGTLGTLTVHGDGAYIQISRASAENPAYFLDQQFHHVAPPVSATVTAFRELRAAVDDPAQLGVSPAEIEAGARMLMGCVWSHLEGGRPVDAREVPRDLVVTGRFRDLYA